MRFLRRNTAFGSSFLLVDIEKINGAVVTGDGNATPWDGA